jgi:transcriptional regulator with GAF, ATPase, and Fis domain
MILSATLDEVNSETNLVALCRNCHWEFDHGFLEVCGIKKVCKEIEKFTSCIECGSKIQKTSVRCKSCSDKYNGQKRQKISWPDSNRLKNMLEEHNMNWSALARTLGVSCNSIRRRFRDHP